MKRIPRRIFVAGPGWPTAIGPREAFKREAIKLVSEQGLTIAEASRKLDTGWPTGWPRARAIASKSLRTWMKQEQSGELKASLGAGKLSADQLRIRELERELSIAKTDGVALG